MKTKIQKNWTKGKTYKVLILSSLFLIFLFNLNLISSDSIGNFKQGSCIDLKVTSNSSDVTISSISFPNTTKIIGITGLSKTGVTFNYTFCNTKTIGSYLFDYNDSSGFVDSKTFNVTPSGESGSDNQVFFIIFFIMAYGIGFFGFFGKNMLLSFIGGITIILLGIYMISSGIIVYRSEFTVALSYLTLAIGFIFMLVPAVETIQDNI